MRILSFIILTVTLSFANISQKQLDTLQTVRDVARTIADYKGETYENTLSAICLAESSAGVHVIGDFDSTVYNASLGPMQIRLQTARYVARLTPSLNYLNDLSDKKLASLLLTNLKVSAQISAHLLVRLSNNRKRYYNTVSGYNGGYSNKRYYTQVMKNMKLVRKLVKDGKLK